MSTIYSWFWYQAGHFEAGPFEAGPFEAGPFEAGPFEDGRFVGVPSAPATAISIKSFYEKLSLYIQDGFLL
jgi:hypothetical protein